MATLSDKRLGYGKILKKMDAGEYNFLGKELHQIAEGFVYEEKDVINFIERLKDRLRQSDNICGSNVFEDIDKLAGDALLGADV